LLQDAVYLQIMEAAEGLFLDEVSIDMLSRINRWTGTRRSLAVCRPSAT
jgi:hypothetical protein